MGERETEIENNGKKENRVKESKKERVNEKETKWMKEGKRF